MEEHPVFPQKAEFNALFANNHPEAHAWGITCG